MNHNAAWRGMARLGRARQGGVWHGFLIESPQRVARPGQVGRGWVRRGRAWILKHRYTTPQGVAGQGAAGQGRVGHGFLRQHTARRGGARRGGARPGLARQGMDFHLTHRTPHRMVRRGAVGPGWARHGWARQGFSNEKNRTYFSTSRKSRRRLHARWSPNPRSLQRRTRQIYRSD